MEQKENLNKQFAAELLYGKQKKLTLPSGYYVVIREQNGADDDIISNQATAKDLTNMDIFIAALVLETNLPFAVNGKLTSKLAENLLLRDKYFIMFASRIHSMGNIVKFEFDWGQDNGGLQKYSDDLNNYVWDYSTPMPEKTDPEYYEYRIEPYDHALAYNDIEVTLESGKVIRFNFLDTKAERKLMKLPLDQQSRNTDLRARNLMQKGEEGWQKVENFQFFTKKEMIDIHKIVSEYDPPFQGLTELENPIDKSIIKYPILSTRDFFYPVEI